jgi:hypothetical protein
VSNRSTSPDIGGTNLEVGGAWAGRFSPGSSLAFGRGYARKQLSEDGDRAHSAWGFGDVEIV